MSTDRPAATDQTTQVHGPTPVERARSVVTDTITAARIRGDGPWTTADAVLTALEREGFAVAAKPSPLLPPRPMTDEEAAEFKRLWSATVAPRASEAPGDAQSPTPDVGAMRGMKGGSAAESEPRDTVKRRILETLDRWHEVGGDTTGEFAGVMEAVDDYATAIRAQVADEIARDICEPMDDCDRPSCPDCIRHEYAQRLARRIRGDQ